MTLERIINCGQPWVQLIAKACTSKELKNSSQGRLDVNHVFESERTSGCGGRGTAQSTSTAFLSSSPTLPVVGLPPFPRPKPSVESGIGSPIQEVGLWGLNPGNVGFMLCKEGEIEKCCPVEDEGKEAAGQTDKFQGHTPPLLPSQC